VFVPAHLSVKWMCVHVFAQLSMTHLDCMRLASLLVLRLVFCDPRHLQSPISYNFIMVSPAQHIAHHAAQRRSSVIWVSTVLEWQCSRATNLT